MQSNNPVFRSAAFKPYESGTAQQGYGQAGYTDPSTWGTGAPGQPTTSVGTGPLTIDSIVQKTAFSLTAVIVAAAITWVVTADITDPNANLAPLIALMSIGSLVAFVLSMVNSFKRVISPALVIGFCLAEGVALGGLSKFFDSMFQNHIVVQAVIGTFGAFAGTLAAYKFLDIKV